jgi:phi13 family phage major tail protein
LTSTGTYTTPIAIPGAVTLTLDPAGEETIFYADDRKYFTTAPNNGYTGSLSAAYLPDDLRAKLLGQTVDENGLLVESADDQPSEFALLFEIQGDAAGRRYVFYDCKFSRPSESHNSKTEGITPDTDTLNLTVVPKDFAGEYYIKSSVENETGTATVYAAWFTAVKIPDFTPEA